MSPFSTPFIIPSISTHTHTLILLHDRSSSGQTFALDLLNATDSSGRLLQTIFPQTKFVFPTATAQCVTSRDGIRMNQWFDLFSTEDPSKREALQVRGLRDGCRFLHDLIDAEAGEGIPLKNIFLGGFGMGSAMALYALLTHHSDGKGQLGGFVGMSGWLPLKSALVDLTKTRPDSELGVDEGECLINKLSAHLRNQVGVPLDEHSNPVFSQMPLFLGHGQADDIISFKLAKAAESSLNDFGLNVGLKEYLDLGHDWRSGDEMDDIANFLSFHGLK